MNVMHDSLALPSSSPLARFTPSLNESLKIPNISCMPLYQKVEWAKKQAQIITSTKQKQKQEQNFQLKLII